MEAMFQEFIATSTDLVCNHLSEPLNPMGMSGQNFFCPSSSSSGMNSLPESKSATKEGDEKEGDCPDPTLKFISHMLMEEEELENQPCMLSECLAYKATEEHFSDVLHGTGGQPDGFTSGTHPTNTSSELLSVPIEFPHEFRSCGKRTHDSPLPDNESAEIHQRNPKYLAASELEESEEPLDDTFYDALLCPVDRTNCDPKAAEKTRRRRKKKGEVDPEFVDVRGLLTQCAQSMANYDMKAANETLRKIRVHCSPHGGETERTAFYLANALEARANGMGTSLYATKYPNSSSAADMVKAVRRYVQAVPFMVVSTMMANLCIGKLAVAEGVTSLHIIDFGVLYGFQWPSFIQGLSMRPGGPPRLRITGIEFPRPGFRPDERVRATGLRLEKYCKRFNVPFEFKAIARNWESITLVDLEIDRAHDVLVVNCLDRLGNVLDETVVPSSPRDTVLNLIKNINPDVFIHSVVNGTYNAPFFDVRFREALFHFSSLFDMFDATLPSEDKDRRLFEETAFGKILMNVIACEGIERVERPETYRKWQLRSLRAGLQQLPLDQEIVKSVTEKVKSDYNKNFSVEEDENWLLQGWKGRVHHALSFWKANNS
ncbi:unnamed protein product [Cuscuta epithymum]|uniref:Scarecrow-like protein 30 n=1 Tax=Cuscuta epithymum TaxID=186058 RepID=A0AAV0DU28_9ASTE|nr:unnamed protein product [Cuscuta epithymum]